MIRPNAIVAALAVLLTAAPALAGPGPRGRMHKGRAMLMKAALLRAGLSDAQLQRIRAIHLDSRRKAIRLRAQLAEQRLALRELMGGDAIPAEARVRDLARRISRLHGELLALRLTTQLRVRRVMSPAQWKKVRRARAELMAKAVEARLGRRGHGRRGGPPAPMP